MKRYQFFLLVFILLIPAMMQAQTKLPESTKGSANSYIYAIGRDDLRKIYLKDKNPSDEMLGTYITDFPRGNDYPNLPRGNYVVVNAVENELAFTDYTIDDLYFKVVPSDELMLCLYDSLGNFIPDATVKCGSRTLKFDKTTQTYNAGKVKNEQVLEINNKGVYHYIEIEKNGGYYTAYKKNVFKSIWMGAKRFWYNLKQDIQVLFDPDSRIVKNKYTGFVVFSKPRYKPGETVKLKGYMAKHNGKPYNKPVDIRLYSYYPTRMDTVLTHISPYRPGMYEYEFQLSDSLNLTLDTGYNVELKTDNDRHNTVSGNFRYEDYELKGIRFSMETDKDEYTKGDSVKVKFNVTDVNEMAVYDGTIELQVKSRPLTPYRIKDNVSGFVPDSLWSYTLVLDGAVQKEIIIPDSVFPPGISFDYQISATYLSADNEKRTAQKLLSRKAGDYIIDFSLKKGMLTITELQDGKSQPVMADISIDGEDGETIISESVMLPHTLPLPWFAADVTVKTSHTTDYYFTDGIKEEQIGYQFYRSNDSIFLKVDNPAGIPFWYTVYRNKSEIARGYTTRLDYAVKDNNQAYNMQLSYLLGEKSKVIERNLPFVQKNISMDVSTPTSVFPGQTADVVVSVKDKKGKPVSNVDITAYSFTSKFEYYQMPGIAVRGKTKYARNFENTRYEPDRNSMTNRKTDMAWNRWKSPMALDTIEYYRFLYPETYYVYTEPTPDGTTLVSPYVIVDGGIQMVHMMWIDERLYYTSMAGQPDIYTFPVEAGKHTFRFRTFDREVSVHNLLIKGGHRNIFSFNVERPYMKLESMDKKSDIPLVISSRLLKDKERSFPNTDEKEILAGQMITMDNNFGTIRLPNLHKTVDIPAYIQSGGMYYYINSVRNQRYDQRLRGFINTPVLLGPFPKRNMVNGISNVASVCREDNDLVTLIDLEGGNHYTVYPGYQKIKTWDKTFFRQDTRQKGRARNFREMPQTVSNILRDSREKILSLMRESYGIAESKNRSGSLPPSTARLSLYTGKDTDGRILRPALIFIVPEDIGRYRLYYGATREFTNLPSGKVDISLIFNDSTSYTQSVVLHEKGQNFLRIDSVSYDKDKEKATTAFSLFNRGLIKAYNRNPYLSSSGKDSIVKVTSQEATRQRRSSGEEGAIAGIVRDSEGEPLIGVSVQIRGTTIGTITDFDGYFELSGGGFGDKIEISYIGYNRQTIDYIEGQSYDIRLEEDSLALDEVVVVGYGTQKKVNLTGSVSVINEAAILNSMQGKLAGVINVRGTSSVNGGSPLILVNGVPFNGDINELDPNNLKSINILKDASATAIYGARAANGVVMIQTNDGVMSVPEEPTDGGFPVMEGGNTMRRNFHDDAFWQPRLKTNDQGEATFQVTYPDDITSWDSYFIAVGNKKQTDKKQMTIKSFKALAASLSTPRFAVRGDSLNVVGRITNHIGDSISISRKIDIAGQEQEDNISLVKSHVDYIPVMVQDGDSLTVAYSMQLPAGYFDGEERSFPIIEQGMQQTFGEFKVLSDTVTHTFNPVAGLGIVTINAEASSLKLFLEEIEKVDAYPYMCNEQMASKIKVLLSKKRISEIFNLDFKEEKKINNLISRLHKNRNKEGRWGWWNKDNTETWISNQVVSALMDAGDAGFVSGLDTIELRTGLTEEFQSALRNLQLTTPDNVPYAKQELLDRLIMLKRLQAPIEYSQYFGQIDKQLPSLTLADRLKTMEAMAEIGLADKINMDSLMHYSHKTILGSMYWGDEKETSLYGGRFFLPYRNNTTHTLTAYKILRAVGGYEKEMEMVRNYFFERRRGGSWANTYESSRIIETIMPDMLTPDQSFAEVTMTLNGRKITQFPFTEEIESQEPVRIRKEGTMPVFATVYQQTWNPAPEPETDKGFAVKSVFTTSGDTISYLTAGKSRQLEVLVTMDLSAEYVQIEVPIPAGCSYDSKRVNFRNETHREHFKDKVVIFCNRLPVGEHRFKIDLIPRFTGSYSLNPAKAELMYFPVFYGNEGMKRVVIH